MNAAIRYVVRQFSRRRLRTAAGALGIFFTIALLVSIKMGLDSIATSYTDLVALQAGKADLLITAKGGHLFRPEPFEPAEVLRKLSQDQRLRGLAPRWAGVVQIEARGVPRAQDALLIGVDPKAEHAFDLWGLRPEPVLEGSACSISGALAKRLGAHRGDKLTVVSAHDGSQVDLRLEMEVDRQLIVPQEVRDFIVVNEAAARTILGEADRVHFLAGAFRSPTRFYDGRDLHHSVLQLKRAGESIAAALGPDFEVRLPKANAMSAFQHAASPVRAVFGVFAFLALSVTGLLVYSIVSVAVEERIREYAILRTVGARRRSILRLVLTESTLLCCIGVLPGVLAGAGVARIVVALVELAMHAPLGSVTLAFSWPGLGLALAVGAALSIGSALVPALQATRWHIVDALDPLRRGQVRAGARSEGAPQRPLLFAGVALSALSVVVFFVLPTAFLSGNSSLIGTVVLCLLLTILLGFTLVAVGTLPWLEALIMRLIGGVLGPTAELARRNLDRHRRRHTTTALMFTLSVSLVIFVASLVVLFSRMSMTMVEHFNGADVRLHSDDSDALGLKTELAGIRGVERVTEVRQLRSRTERGTAYDAVLSDIVGMKHLWVVPFGVDRDLDAVLYTRHIRYAEGGPEALRRVALDASIPGEAGGTVRAPPVVLSLAAARFLEVRAGDLVQLDWHLGPDRRVARFKVAAICETLAGFDTFRSRVAHAIGSGMLMPMLSFRHMAGEAPADAQSVSYFVKVSGNEAAQRATASEIRDRFDLRFRFGVRSAAEQKREAAVMYWATQVFFGLLLVVAVVISVFALIASMAASVIERRWEMGMLRAMGLRRSHLFRMFLGEALGVTLSAGVAGGVIGFALAWLFVLQAGKLAELPVVFAMPYVTFLATLGISLAAGAVAAHLPTRRLLRKPVAEILRQGS